VEEGLERFFAACELVKVAPQAGGWVWPLPGLKPEEAATLTAEELRGRLAAGLPAAPVPEGVLDLDGGLNPEWEEKLDRFRRKVLERWRPGLSQLGQKQWRELKRRMGEYRRWRESCPAPELMAVPEERLMAYLEGKMDELLLPYFREGKSRAIDLEGLRKAEKLVLYQRDLLRLVNNFVSFPDLYDPTRRALFEEGELVMDGRVFRLAVGVRDRARHKQAAQRNPLFTMYVRIRRQMPEAEREVAVPVTWGTRGNLRVGKRGVFRHVDGTEWLAEVVEIVDYPVSLWEAVAAPFRKMGEALTRRIEQMTSAAEGRLEAVAAGKEKVVPGTGMSAGGLLAGGGIAVAAVGSSLAYIVKTLSSLKWWQVAAGVGGALAAVLVPGMVLAELRLRRADLSSLLEGAGWGINLQMRLTGWQRRFFTYRPSYPEGSRFVPGLSRRVWGLLAVAIWLAVLKLGQLAR